MKYVTYESGGQTHLGALIGNGVVSLSALGLPQPTMLDFIQAGATAWEKAARAVETARPLPLSKVSLSAPLFNPRKIVAIGLNYMDHCREQNITVPARPLVFTKFPSAIIGPGQPIRWDPADTKQVDYEVELGVVIGRTARRVPAEQALEYVFGYTILNDISARDLQFSDRQWVRAKSFDTFCPTGPAIVTADEIPDPQNLHLRCTVNEQVMQDSTTAEMIFSVRYLIADLSRFFTFQPGDIIATGTPAGVGVFRNPPVFLKDGDRIACEIEGLGRLENPVAL